MAVSAWPGTSSINNPMTGISGPSTGVSTGGTTYSPSVMGNALSQLNGYVGNGLQVNPGGIAGTQNTLNQGTSLWNAGLNRVNSSTPWGSTSYGVSIDPKTGMPTATSNLSLNPTLTQAQNSAQSSALNSLQNSANSQGIGTLTGNVNQSMGDPAIQNAIQSQYNAQMGLLQPTFGIQSEQLDSQLANQGLTPGSEAYNNAKNLLSQQQNNAYTQVANNATQGGLAQQNQMFNQSLQNANLGNSVANQPLNQLLALNSGSQVNAPQAATSNAVGTDVLGASQLANQGNLNQYNANTGNQNAMLSGLYGVGNSLLNAYATNPNIFSNLFGG